MLKIVNLSVEIDNKPILNNISLTFKKGETHAIMGRNGSGKSSFSKVLAGHPQYKVVNGSVTLTKNNNEKIDFLKLSPEERAWSGFFLNYQYPVEIPGLPNHSFLKTAYNSLMKYRGQKELDAFDFRTIIEEKVKELQFDNAFLDRSLNVGFSGGEKKRNEILQLKLLDPSFAFLDELDSGLDIDALKLAMKQILLLKNENLALIFITHYANVISYIKPDFIHIMHQGKVVMSSQDIEIAEKIEQEGFEFLLHGKN